MMEMRSPNPTLPSASLLEKKPIVLLIFVLIRYFGLLITILWVLSLDIYLACLLF